MLVLVFLLVSVRATPAQILFQFTSSNNMFMWNIFC